MLDTPLKQSISKEQRSRLFFILRLTFGVAIIGLLIWKADFTQVVDTLTRINPFWLALAVGIQIVAKLVWALRWSVLLDIFGIPASFLHLVKGIFVGLFFSNFLPTSFGGDLYRGYWILNDKKLYPKSIFSIFTERFIGLGCLGFIALPAFLLLLQRGAVVPAGFRLILLLLLGGLCGSILALHPAIFAFLDRLLFPSKTEFLAGIRHKVIQALQSLQGAGPKRWKIYLFSFGVHLAGIVFFYCLGRSLYISLEVWHYFVIVPLMIVATLLPISFNGLGVREGALVLLTTALGAGGIYPAQAIALGLISSLVIFLVSLIGGGFYIVGKQGKEAYVT